MLKLQKIDVKKPRVDIPAGAQLKKKRERKKKRAKKASDQPYRRQKSASIIACLASFVAIQSVDRSDNRSAFKLSLC
jgi:hypothetical protein